MLRTDTGEVCMPVHASDENRSMDYWKGVMEIYLILISRLAKDLEPHSGQVALISENSIIDPSGASLMALITVVGKKKPVT